MVAPMMFAEMFVALLLSAQIVSSSFSEKAGLGSTSRKSPESPPVRLSLAIGRQSSSSPPRYSSANRPDNFWKHVQQTHSSGQVASDKGKGRAAEDERLDVSRGKKPTSTQYATGSMSDGDRISKDWLSLGQGSLETSSDSDESEADSETSEDEAEDEGAEEDKEVAKPSSHRKDSKDDDKILLEWNKQVLGTHMPVEDMVDKVRAMRIEGVSRQKIGRWIKRRLKEMGEEDYLMVYSHQMELLSNRVSKMKRSMRKDPAFQLLDPELQEKVARDHLRRIDETKLEKSRQNDPSNQRSKGSRFELRTTKVGVEFETYFKAKNMDVNQIPVKDLESETRNLGIRGMAKSRFTTHLYQYLRSNRPEIDLNTLIELRKKNIKNSSWKRRLHPNQQN